MNDETSHLTAGAAALLAETDERRIRAIRSRRWVLYPRAKQALDRLSALLDHPRGTRMPSIAIYGDSGMGKTMIMKRFRDEHPPSFNPLTGTLKTPVLAIEMTSRPGERRFYSELLTLLGAPQRPRADIAQMEQAALRIMEAIGVQVLVIDEVHNILAGSYREQRIVLNTLRFLSNRLQISLVCFGVNEAREAISGDVQLARRFEQFTLSRWAANEQFETLAASICATRRCVDPPCLRRNRCDGSCRSPRASRPTSSTWSTTWRSTPSKTAASTSTTKQSRTGSQSSMPRRHSHDREHSRTAIAGAVATLFGRTPVVLDRQARQLLCGSAVGHASALPAGGLFIACSRSSSKQRSGNPLGQHVGHGSGRGASNDIRKCREIIAPPHRRAANADLHELQPGHKTKPAPILRSQLLGWRITCPLCESQLRDAGGREFPSPFQQYRGAALRGQNLLDDEAERGIRTWTSPADIARLLLMRRVPTPLPREHDLWRFRVLGAVIPDLDHVIAERQENLPTPAKPILPLHLRPALLAGVAIVERAGPEMLRMLRGHMMGDNRVRFTDAAESMIARARRSSASSQMQLI